MTELSLNSERGRSPELAELERLVAARRDALEREGKPALERELFREVFRERYGDVLAPGAPPPPSFPPASAPPAARDDSTTSDPKREAELEEYVVLAFTKGVAAAADAARRTSPWLMDELHDRLVDRYYDELIAAKQVKPL